MSRDYLRDYSTEAFKLYAKNGSLEKYKEKLYEEIIASEGKGTGISNPTEAQLIKKEKILIDKKASLDDMEAVEKTLKEFSVSNPFTVMIISEVYFIRPNEEQYKGYIQDRVIAAAIKLNVDTRTIYRHLKNARTVFSINRGLRVESEERREKK